MAEWTAWLESIDGWLAAHIEPIELITVWVLFGRSMILAASKFLSWWTIRHSRDRTSLGGALKREKLAEGFGRLSLGVYWAMILASYYADHQWGIWANYGIVAVLLGGAIPEIVFTLLFVTTLRREDRHAAEQGRDAT